MRMKILLVLALGFGCLRATLAYGEAGLESFEKVFGGQLPLMEDPSALLDEEPAPPPQGLAAEPFKTETKPPADLGKSIAPPPNLPIATTIHPETAIAPKDQKPLIPVKRSEVATSVALPQPEAPKLASPVALPANTGPAEVRAPANAEKTADKMVETKVSLTQPAPAQGPELAIVLSEGKFHPSRIRLKQGEQTKLLFTTIGKKPAALIIERLRVQKWLSRPEEAALRAPASTNSPWEVNREVSSNRMTEVLLDPVRGSYSFHDAISGATGEIVVE